jgi:ABC-type transporter Mla subunit MlaD
VSKTCANCSRAERRATVARRLRTARTPALLVTVTVLVAAALIAVLPQIRLGSANTYHANFAEGAGLRAGQPVRIAAVPVGKVDAVDKASDDSINVTFTVAKTYQLYTSTRALIRHENVVGDHYLEITMGPGELHKLPVGATINQAHTATVLDNTAKLTQGVVACDLLPAQPVVEQTRPPATTQDDRKVEVNPTTAPLAENYLRLNALGAYGYFFNIYYCSIQTRIKGPGSDILIPFGGPPDPTNSRCAVAK